LKAFLLIHVSTQAAVFGGSQGFSRHYLNVMRTLPRSSVVLSLLPTRASIPSKISTSRCFHCSGGLSAVAHPITAHGPPPKAPVPAPEFGERVERRKKQAELIQQGKEIRAESTKPSAALKKRFWKDVHVKQTPGALFSLVFRL
jgi:ATP synthase F1 complex assembly factor 2